MKLNIDSIFILHHKPLKDRKKLLLQKLSDLKIDNKINWIEDFLPEDIKHIEAIVHKNGLVKPGQKLLPASLSNYMKHEKAIKIQKKKKLKYVLIHEDDVLIPDDYINIINKNVDEFKKTDGDLLMIGTCCDLRVKKNELNNKNIYYKPEYRTRCLHAYVVNLKCVDLILKEMKVYDDAPDWKLNRIIDKYNLKCYWVKDSLYQNRNFKTTVNW